MNITVCSGFSPAGYKEYGYNFLQTFNKFWSKDVNLIVYTEEIVNMPRGECRNLWNCDGAREFYTRHKNDGRRCGTSPIDGWRSKDRNEGYTWRFDAVKFFKQCLIPYNASKNLKDGDILVWLDGDVVTFDYVPRDFIPNLMKGVDLVYLGRGNKHSEIGFWAVRLCALSRDMLHNLAGTYTTDSFLQLKEHHSAFVFDYVRRQTQNHGLTGRDLTFGGRDHVWLSSPLAKYTDHLKGKRRKLMGHSLDHPIKWWERHK